MELSKIDPATLKAGPETDILVAHCLRVKGKAIGAVRNYSLDTGVAFSVLWSWLEEHASYLIEKHDGVKIDYRMYPSLHTDERGFSIFWHGLPTHHGDQPSYFQVYADSWALLLCRAVVAVTQRESGMELLPGWKKWNDDLKRKCLTKKGEAISDGTLASSQA